MIDWLDVPPGGSEPRRVAAVARAFWKDGKRKPENGCCSAIEPCPTQQRDPNALCDNCTKAAALAATPVQEPEGEPWEMVKVIDATGLRWEQQPVNKNRRGLVMSNGRVTDWGKPLYARPALSAADGEVICDGCGSTWTSAQLAEEKRRNPKLLSCCPERKPLTIGQWRDRALAAEARVAEADALREALAEILPINRWPGAPSDEMLIASVESAVEGGGRAHLRYGNLLVALGILGESEHPGTWPVLRNADPVEEIRRLQAAATATSEEAAR